MSVIRFVHTDSLRLGSPVSLGLSDCPEWLRKVAGSAVRTAVTNVFEAAIAGRCHLLLIAGRLTESGTVRIWISPSRGLKAQVIALREHGIHRRGS